MRQETVRLCPARTSRARPPVPVEHDQRWPKPGAEFAPGAGIGEGSGGAGESPGFPPPVRELVEVNEKICRLRPVAQIKHENELQALKKNCRRVLAEAAQEVGRLVQSRTSLK